MRYLSLIVLCLICTFTQVAYATDGGEGENLEIFQANTFTATATCKDTVQQCVAACND